MPDIRFECPKCKQTLAAPEELATELIECPTCNETIEVPVRSQREEVPKPPELPRPCPPQATCSKCGVTMLATTDARTGGLCMACKQGIREHIEAAKVRYQEERQEHRAHLAELERKKQLISSNPNLGICKTCTGIVAVSTQVCVHCGQKWPTLDLRCDNCGSFDIDLVTVEDTSSLFVTPSLAGVLAAGLFEAMRPEPQTYAVCQQCGCSLEVK
jgi:hypothetical protein